MKWPLAFLVAIYALAVVGLAVFQRRLLYFPGRRLTHPAEAGMSGVEELRLVTDDGEMLVAWHLPPRKGWFVSRRRFTPVWPLGIVIQATKNDVGFLQFVDSGLQAPYCALEMAWFLIFKSAMEIVHVSPATVFHVRQALTVKD